MAGWKGKRGVINMAGRKCRRAGIPVVAGLFFVLISLAGMIFYGSQERKRYRELQQVKGGQHVFTGITEGKNAGAVKGKLRARGHGRGRKGMADGGNSIGLSYDWDLLAGINGDIRGWLYLPDTSVDFPVAGASDNDYYLSHDFRKREDSAGCPFMDKDTGQQDFNRTVYAHNMGRLSGAMFSPLVNFKDRDYFMAHRKLYYSECYGDVSEYWVMAVVEYNAGDMGAWDFRTRNHADMESYNRWMGQLRELALYYVGAGYEPEKILTLCTCDRSRYGKDGRLVIVAGKVNKRHENRECGKGKGRG